MPNLFYYVKNYIIKKIRLSSCMLLNKYIVLISDLIHVNHYLYCMLKISIKYGLKINLIHNEREYDLETALQLLDQIQQNENLSKAADQCGFSYRKAWNKLKQLENLFGLTLVEKQRGKGSQLSELGQALLDITRENKPAFNEYLSSAENKVNKVLNLICSASQPLRVIASDSEKLDQLRQQQTGIELDIDGSVQALSAYAEGKCELAGFHIKVGEGNRQQLNEYCQYLNPKHDKFILLEQRQQGLISRYEQPVDSLQQLVDQKLTFVNRQQGSGTRFLLDNLLKEQHIHPDQLSGYFHEEHTHLAVASMIVSQQADAGLGTQTVANRLKLHFTPVSHELYFLVFKTLTPQLQQLINGLTDQNTLEVIGYKEFVTLLTDKL